MEIYQKAFDIIERYFGTEEEDKDVSSDLELLKINNYFFFDRLLQLLMQINLLLVLEETVSHLSRDSTSKNI